MKKSYRDDNGEKIFRYSIRKYHFGAASVAVAALMFFANGAVAASETITPATTSDVVTTGSDGNADGDPEASDEGDSKKALTDQPAELKSADQLKAQEAPAEGTNQGQAGAESNSAQSETNPANQEPSQAGEVKDKEQPTVADTTAAKSTQGNLQALLAKLTLSSMQELHAEVEERLAAAKAVLEDSKATQAQVDEQARLMTELMSRVNQALTPSLETPTILEKAGLTSIGLTPTGLASPEGATTAQTSGGKGRRRALSEPTSDENQVRPSAGGDSTGSGAGSQATPQTLPTYTNTEGKNGVYDLKDELEFITDQLRANNASEDKIQAAKAAADKFNEAFSKGDTISQEDFSAALADLKKSRDLIEGVLAEKEANGGEVTGPVNPAESATPSANNVTIQPRTSTTGWSGFRSIPAGAQTRNARAAGQDRAARDNGIAFIDAKRHYFDNDVDVTSPYDQYTYAFWNKKALTPGDRPDDVADIIQYLKEDVEKTSTGFRWRITVNPTHKNLDGVSLLFTVPSGQSLKASSVTITKQTSEGSTSYNTAAHDGKDELAATMETAGFDNVKTGTPTNTGAGNVGNFGSPNYYKAGSVSDWVFETQGNGYYVRGNPSQANATNGYENTEEQGKSTDKVNQIIRSSGKTYYGRLQGNTAYRIEFETTGGNDLDKLDYLSSIKGFQDSHRYFGLQMHARLDREVKSTGHFRFLLRKNGYFQVNQDHRSAEFGTAAWNYNVTKNGITYQSVPIGSFDGTDSRLKGILTYNPSGVYIQDYNRFDIRNYGEYKDKNGDPYRDPKGKKSAYELAEENGQHFAYYTGTTSITPEKMVEEVSKQPGVHTYTYVRSFTDGSQDKGTIHFVTKPKTPTIETDLSNVGDGPASIVAGNGTQGLKMYLYRKGDNNKLIAVRSDGSDVELDSKGKPVNKAGNEQANVTAGANGKGTFNISKLQLGEYVVKTVVDGTWYDYKNNDKKEETVESDESNVRKTLPAKIGPANTKDGDQLDFASGNKQYIGYPQNQHIGSKSIRFLVKGATNITKLEVDSGDGYGKPGRFATNFWRVDGLNSQKATVRAWVSDGINNGITDNSKSGITNLKIRATLADGTTKELTTSLIIPPNKQNLADNQNPGLVEKANEKPTIQTKSFGNNLNGTYKVGDETLVWKALLVKGGSDDYDGVQPITKGYDVVAETSLNPDGTATFTADSYKKDKIGTDPLRVTLALVNSRTNQVFENLVIRRSDNSVQATVPNTNYTQKQPHLTFIQGETPTWGDPKGYFTYENGDSIGTNRTFLWKNSSNQTAPNNPDLSVGTGKIIEVLASNPGGTPKTINLTYDVVAPVTPNNNLYTVKGKDFVKPNTTTTAVASDFYNNTTGKTIAWKTNSAPDKNAAVGQNHTATATVTYPGVDKDGNAITRDIAVTYGIVDSSLTKHTWAADYNGKLTTGTGTNPDADARNYLSKDSYTNGKIQTAEFVATSRTNAEAPSTTKPGSVNKEIKVTYDNGQTQNFGLLVQVRPDKPRITDDLGEKAGLNNQTVTVTNVPANAGTVNVTLKVDGNVITGTRTTVNGSTATVTVPGVLPKGAITATVALTNTSHDYQTNQDQSYTLNSDESDAVNSRGRKPQKPDISQNKEGDLAVTATIGQDGANKAIFSYTTTGNQTKEITFEKGRDGTWSKVGATTDSTVAIRNNANGTAEIHMTGGTATAGTSVSIKQQTAYSDFTDPATLTAYGRMTTPNLNAREDTSVTITPASDANKLTVTYTPSNQTAATTVTLAKNNAGQWQNQTGFSVSGNTVTLTAGTAKAGTTVSAKAESPNTISLVGEAQAKPAVPEINGSGAYANALDSTSRIITGRGLAGAIIKITLQDGSSDKTTTVASDGSWSYTLAANETLTQNKLADNTSGYSNQAVRVKQVVNGVESGSASKDVLIGFPTLDNPVAAGRDITFSLPKDVGLSYLQFNSGYREEVTVKRDNGVWKLDGRFKDKLSIETVTQDNPSITKLKISVTNPTTESAIPFRLVEGNQNIRLRMHKSNASGTAAPGTSQITVGEGTDRGDWIYANVTNEKPSIAAKATIKDTYVANEKLTKAKLLDLVTVTDAEDDAAKTVGLTAKQKVTVAISKGGQAFTLADGDYLKEGDYNLVYSTSDAAGKAADNLTRTIHVQSIKDATNISLTQKEVFTSADIANNSFTDSAKDRFVAKIKQQNPNLPANTRVEKVTDSGLGNVVKLTFEDGSEKLVTGSDIAVPAMPTVTPESGYGQNLSSTTRSISGTGIPGATIKITLQNNKEVSTTVGTTGAWTYDLQDGELLSQNEKQDATTKVANPVSVKQEIGGMISAPQNVTVSLGQARFEGTPLQAGRDIVVRVPHDASRFYVTIASKDGSKYQYGVSKTAAGGWQVVEERATSGGSFTATGRSTTDLTEEQSNNPSEKLLKLHIKDANTKADIPFTIPSGSNSVIARVHYDNRNVSPAGDFARATATNTDPSIAVNEPNTHDYTADGSLTLAGLKSLVTVTDAEDDANKTVGSPARENVSVTIQKDGQAVTLATNDYLKKGNYTVTYTVRDAAGATATKTHTLTVSSLAESKGGSIVYPSDDQKVVYGNSDIVNGNFTDSAKTGFATKLQDLNKTNTNLPTINGQGVTFTAGATDDKNKVVTVRFPDGSSLDVPSDKLAKRRPTQPEITSDNNGDVTVTPVNEPNVNSLKVTYTPADNHQLQEDGTVTTTPQTETEVIATKGADNQWTITRGQKDGISIDATTGAITLRDEVVKDQTDVKAKDIAQTIEGDEARGRAANGDQTKPVIDANSTLIGVGKQLNIPLTLSDGNGVGIDEGNIKVTNLPNGLTYDSTKKTITGTLSSVTKHDITVRALDKNGNKAEKVISVIAVKPKPIYAIKDGNIPNVDTPSNFVEVPTGVTSPSVAWKDGQPTTTTVGNSTKTVTVSAQGYTSAEVDVPVTVYPGVTYRKVKNKEVTEYDEIVGQPLTSSLVPGGGRFNPVTPDYYIAFENGTKPTGTMVEFEGGTPAERSTAAGVTTKTIVVTYPHGAGIVKKTVTFKTYGNEANYETGKDSIETTVGTEFSKLTARNSVKLSDPNVPNPSGTFIGWWKNGGYAPENKIGKREENINVWYGSNVENKRGDDTHNYSDQNVSVTLAVKPQAPTLQGQAGTKPAVTVSNLPEASQLATGATVKVQLKDAQGTVVAEKEVTAGATTVTFDKADYKKDLTLGEKLNANVLVSGTYKKTVKTDDRTEQVDTPYALSSANSNQETVKTYADFYRNQVKYPTDAEKVTYGASDIVNGNFTDAAKDRFAAKLQEVNASNSKLPTGVTYTKGTTDDKEKVAVINFPDRSTIDISHAVVAKPEVPTITLTHDDKVSDADRTISGTALQNATKVTIQFQDGRGAQGRVDVTPVNGKWTYTLPPGRYLRQTEQTTLPGSSSVPLSVTQTVFDAVSDAKKVYVAKDRNFAGKTITGVRGSAELEQLKSNPKVGISYTERGTEQTFPSDFDAAWKTTPDVTSIGTRTYIANVFEKDRTDRVSQEVPVKVVVKPSTPSLVTAVGKKDAGSVTVNGVNSGTTVALYDMSNPANPIELGRTDVPKDGDFTLKDGVAINLAPGKSLTKDMPIAVRSIYKPTVAAERTASDYGTSLKVTDGLKAKDYHLIKGDPTPTDALADRLQYKDDTALPTGSTVEWKETPDYSRVGDATYKATVTIPGSGSTEVTIPVHVYPTVAKASPNGYNNKQGTLSHGADAETYVVFKDGNQTVAKPAGVTVRWQGGTAPGIATASASNVGRIEVEYPADNAAGKTVKTLEVALPTYHAVAKETEVVRTIGSTFASTEASAYVKKAENGPDLPQGTEYTWQTDETANKAYGSGTWGKVNDDWLGKKTNKVKVYYPQVDGGNTKDENLAEETEEITFVTKPATPSITTDLTGSAGTRKTIHIENATPGTTVELYNGDTKIGSVDVLKAGTTRYSDLTTVDLTMTQDIPTSTNITAKAVYKPTEAGERVESDASTAKASTFITLSAKGSIQTMKGTGTLTELDNLNETTLAKLLRRSDAATDFTGATGRWKNRDATRKTAEAGTRTETLLVRLAGQTNEQEVNFTFTTLAQPSAKAVVKKNGQDITNDDLSKYVTADGNNGLSWENQPAKVEVGKTLPRIQVTYPSDGVAVSDVTTQYVTPTVYAVAENPTPGIDAHKGSTLSEDASDYVKPAPNTEGFPNGTTHAWKDGDKPSTDHVGEVTKTVVTTYGKGDDVPAELRGKEVETPVTITVVPDKPVVTPNTDGTVGVTIPEETTKVEVTYTPEGQDAPTTVAVTKNQDGSWTAPADSGITINPDGSKLTVPADKVKDGTGVTAKGITTIDGKDFTSQSSDSADAKAPRLGKPTISQNADYGIEVELDDKATHAEVDYVDAAGNTRKLTFDKEANGDWTKTDNVAIGTVVTTGNKIVMQANTAKAGSKVSATQKSALSDPSEAADHKAVGLLNSPVVTPQIDSGVQIEAPSDATSLEVTYTPAGSQASTKVTLTKTDQGWQVPEGFEVGADGKPVLKAKTATAGTEVTVQAKAQDMESKPSTGKVKTAQPSTFTPESKQNGDVVIPLPADADKVVINYPESDTVTKTVELTKGADGNWSAPADSPITVKDGKATVKQGTASSGKSITAQATAGTGTDVSAAREATITVPSHTQPTVSTITVEADSKPTADSISNAVTAEHKKTAVAKAALPTVAAGTSQTVGVTVTYDDDSTEDVNVTVQAKEATPSEATTKQWQNGDVEIGLPDTADKARLTYTDKQGASQTVELSKGATGWTVTSGDASLLDNGTLRLKPSSYTAGQAVSVSATKGSDATTSQASSASITPIEHTVTTNTLVKPYKQNVTDNDLLDAVNAEHKQTVNLKDGTSYPTTDGFHDIELTVTYEDGSTENVPAKYKVTDASKGTIDKAAETKKAEIDKRTDLTKEEKDKAKSDVETAAEKAKKAIDDATINDKVDEAKNNGNTAIDNI
ncbi:Rib/alpha-like domain-containing protein, partial [Streptococcus pseudopneumoniae]|uniref:Rib/alpha-like domain-containing protein n=1 Tax=Streptococcus pseudopneumoniae TaxID=257758 RepID=UPI00352E3923